MPEESLIYPGYYEIPGFSNYVVSKEGVVINKTTKKIVEGGVNSGGYHNFGLTADSGIKTTIGRHRVLGIVFIPEKRDISHLVINHKDAKPGNDVISNLEWITQKENIEHAGSMGITEKCIPVSVRDVDTGDVKNFPSINECARFYNTTKDSINYRVKEGEKKVFPERRQYRAATSSKDWYIPNSINHEILLNGRKKKVLLKRINTGEVLEFEKLSDLAKYLNVCPATITLWMGLNNQPVLPGYIQLKYAHDNQPWREVKDQYSELQQDRNRKIVKVIHEESGNVMIFNSAKECAESMGLNQTALNYRLSLNGSKVFTDGYRYMYYS